MTVKGNTMKMTKRGRPKRIPITNTMNPSREALVRVLLVGLPKQKLNLDI
jgi:hypothetical protein